MKIPKQITTAKDIGSTFQWDDISTKSITQIDNTDDGRWEFKATFLW